MSITWRAAVAGLEAVSAACALLNLAYFLYRMIAPGREPLSRRVAAAVLALISLAALTQSAFTLSVVLASGHDSVFATTSRAIARALSIAATASVSALVLRTLGK